MDSLKKIITKNRSSKLHYSVVKIYDKLWILGRKNNTNSRIYFKELLDYLQVEIKLSKTKLLVGLWYNYTSVHDPVAEFLKAFWDKPYEQQNFSAVWYFVTLEMNVNLCIAQKDTKELTYNIQVLNVFILIYNCLTYF